VPRGSACAVPYKSPPQPGFRKRMKCSPTRKYSKNPGVRCWASAYQGTQMNAASKAPLNHGKAFHVAPMRRCHSAHNAIGTPTYRPMTGPLASMPRPAATKNP
jgi:hypothetical protein